MDQDPTPTDDFIALAADVTSAYVSNNTLTLDDVPNLLTKVYTTMVALSNGRLAPPAASPPAEKPKPAIPVKDSVHPDHIVCLEEGLHFRSLRRHLGTSHNMTPEQYRAKWDLPADYPMVAPNYAEARSEMAKKIGLGVKRKRP